MTDTREVTVTIFDFTDPENPTRMSASIPYNPADCFPPVGEPLKVSISVGDDFASSVITLPVTTLSVLVGKLMQERARQKTLGLVGFDKPGLIVPN